MNRRAFLLGTIATPIVAKVDAVSAALRPIATPILTYDKCVRLSMQAVMNTKEYRRSYEDMLLYGQATFNPAKAAAEIGALDSSASPCDASIAGRDQIG